MEEENKVILHGRWSSPYVKRVELALKIKGIPFEYIEENLANKSDLLLKYNPVQKKVPVLVHNGKPIVESLIILEYIDETWNYKPRLLPDDPYKRATTRFWADYIQQLLESIGRFLTPMAMDRAAEEKKVVKDVYEKLKVLEEGMKSFLPEKSMQINEENMGLLDIMIFATLGSFMALEEVLGAKIIDPEKCPLIFKWVTDLRELPLVKEITTPHDELVSLLYKFRE